MNAIALQDIYLDWVNNFISTRAFADHYELTQDEASDLIELTRQIHERLVKEAKDYEQS